MVFRNQAPNRFDWRTELYHQVQLSRCSSSTWTGNNLSQTLNLLNYCCIEGLLMCPVTRLASVTKMCVRTKAVL